MIQKEFIRNELRYRYPTLQDSIRAPQQAVGRPLLFEGGTRKVGARIVVCSKYELDTLAEKEDREPLFLCIGSPKKDALARFDVCILPESERTGAVLNFVQRLFDRLDDWTQSLREAAETGEEVVALLQRASDMLQNPVLVLDERGHILAQSDQVERSIETDSFRMDHLPGDTSATGHVLKRTGTDSLDMLTVRLTSGNTHYTLICLASERALYASDEIVLESLAGFLRLMLSERTLGLGVRRFRRENEAAAGVFRSLLFENMPEQEAKASLENTGWSAGDAYAILAIEPKNGDLRAAQADAICDRLETKLAGCCAFTATPQIVAVMRMTLLDTPSLLASLRETTAEHKLLIGVSSAYEGFSLFPQRLEQAKHALNHAGKFGSVASDSDIYEDELLENTQTNIPQELLCMRSVLALARYDGGHNTDYLQTAECYVKNRFNAVRTAGALFIHRSTLLYRLERIREQFGLDLDDREISLLHLLYSLKIAKSL